PWPCPPLRSAGPSRRLCPEPILSLWRRGVAPPQIRSSFPLPRPRSENRVCASRRNSSRFGFERRPTPTPPVRSKPQPVFSLHTPSSIGRNHQTSNCRGDDHAGGSGEDRVLPRDHAERHCDVKQHANCAYDVSDRIGRSDFLVDLLSLHLVPPNIPGYAPLGSALGSADRPFNPNRSA